METDVGSDMGIGLGALFAVVGLVGAVVMYLAAGTHQQVLSGWGFALAMVAGLLAITVMHAYA